jgi:MATE family multidrug resistance protein
MIFTDRIFLARYSLGALNACVNAGTLAWAFMAGIGMVTAMSEIFVAQYNGAKQRTRIGTPIWQMIWFSFGSLFLFIPMAIWGAPFIFGTGLYSAMEIQYFRWLMFFAPSYALMTAFAGFFIGRGQTKVMVWLALAANLINIFLDAILIFGIPGWIPELGVQGAAISTCFGYFFEATMLAYLFLKKENRIAFGTDQWRFNWDEMRKCCKVGLPQGIFCALEVFGWAIFYWMMTSLSEMHITISSICQSFIILFSFFCDGLSRGASAVAGNLIGAKKHQSVSRVLRSSVILIFCFAVATSLLLVVDPVDTANILFFSHFEGAHPLVGTMDPTFIEALRFCMTLSFVYLFFDGLRWVLGGILVASGDTLFLLIFGSLSVWAFLLAPIYLIVVQNQLAVEYAWGLAVLYAIIFALVYWIRFKRGAWSRIDLIQTPEVKMKPVAEELPSVDGERYL